MALLSCCCRSYFCGLGAGVAEVFSYLGGLAGGRAGSLVVGCSPLLAVRLGGGSLSSLAWFGRCASLRSLCASVARVAASSRRSVPLRYSRSAAFRGSSPSPAGFPRPPVGRLVCPVGGRESGRAVGAVSFCAGCRPRLARVYRYPHLYPQKYSWGLYFFLPPSGRGYPSRPSGGSRLADRQLADINDARSHAYASTNVVHHPLTGRTEKVYSYL